MKKAIRSTIKNNKITDKFFIKEEIERAEITDIQNEISKDKLKNYQELIDWCFGKPNEFYMLYGYKALAKNKKSCDFYFYDNNRRVQVSDIKITAFPDGVRKRLDISIFSNSKDRLTITLRNKSGGNSLDDLVLEQTKNWNSL